MTADELRKAARKRRLRELLLYPAVLLRMAALKFVMRTGDWSGLTIEAIPSYYLGVPLKGRYHVCLRSPDKKASLTVEVAVERHQFEKLPAYKMHIANIRFPYHTIIHPWIEEVGHVKPKIPQLYLCNPEKNVSCRKLNCIYNQESACPVCSCTKDPQFAQVDFEGQPILKATGRNEPCHRSGT